MAVTAEKVIVELEARIAKYNRDMESAAKKTEAVFARIRNAEKGNAATTGGDRQRVSKEVSAAAKAEADAVKKAAREKQIADRAAAKSAADRARAEVKATQERVAAETRASATIQRLRNQEAAASNRARSGDFLSSNRTYGTATGSSSGKSARDSASVFQAQFRDQERAAKAAEQASARTKRASEQEARAFERAKAREVAAAAKAARDIEAANRRSARSQRDLFSTVSRFAIGGFIANEAVQFARGLLAIADESKNLEARLRLATAETGNFGDAQRDVRRIAEETRAGLTDTANLYGNFIRNAKDLGITQAESARATETVAKTFKISGAAAVETAQATRQLVQALQSGILRGDEFNSIAEAAPRLMRLLADSLGVPIGQLRKMAEEGELTSKALTKAFTDKRFTDGIDAEFKSLPVTFDDAMTQVRNAALITFGAFDRGGEFSKALSTFVIDGAGGFQDLEAAAVQFGISARANIVGLVDAFAPVFAEGKRLFDFLSGGFQGIDIGRDIQVSLDDIDKLTDSLARSLPLYGNTPLNRNRLGTNFGGRFRQSREAELKRGRLNERSRQYATSLGDDGFSRFVNEPGRYDIFGNLRRPDPAPSIGGTKSKNNSSAETLARRAEAAAQRAERNQQAFDDEQARLNQDILDARRALVTSQELLADLAVQDIETERLAYADKQKSLVAQKRLTQTQADANISLKNQEAALRQSAVNLAEQERALRENTDIVISSLDIDRDILSNQQGLAKTAAERREIALRLIEIEFKIEDAKIAELEASKDASDRAEAARLRETQGIRRGQAVENAERANRGAIGRYRDSLDDPQAQIEDAVAQKLKAVDEGITSAVAKRLGVKDPFLQQLLQIFIQQAILKPIYDAIGSANGGGGGFLGSLVNIGTSVFAGGRASGGNVVAGQLYRVNESASGRVEGFRPAQSGQIIPLGRMAAGPQRTATTIVQNITIDASNSVNPDGFARQILALSRQQSVEVSAAVARAGNRALPGRLSEYNALGS